MPSPLPPLSPDGVGCQSFKLQPPALTPAIRGSAPHQNRALVPSLGLVCSLNSPAAAPNCPEPPGLLGPRFKAQTPEIQSYPCNVQGRQEKGWRHQKPVPSSRAPPLCSRATPLCSRATPLVREGALVGWTLPGGRWGQLPCTPPTRRLTPEKCSWLTPLVCGEGLCLLPVSNSPHCLLR